MYVRALCPAERAGIEAGLRSSNAFSLRRSQIVVASSRGQCPSESHHNLGCATQTVRKQGQNMLDALGAVFANRPFPAAWGT